MREGISEYMDRQKRRAARFGREAEAVAHEAYGKAIRAGENLRLTSPGDVARYGAKLLDEYEGRALHAISDVAQRAKLQTEDVLRRAGQKPAVRSAAVEVAKKAGNVAGAVRGGVHAVEGVVNEAAFLNRLLDPADSLRNPGGESAAEQLGRGVFGAARGAGDYVKNGVANPQSVLNDVTEMGQQWRRDLDPSATQTARTLGGELRRNFDVGQNQGELAFDVGSLALGGPAAKG